MSLRKLRIERGLTLAQLSMQSGLHYIKIHYIEVGKIKIENIRLSTALKLARALDCRPEDLLDEARENASL